MEIETKEWVLTVGDNADIPPDAFPTQEEMLEGAIDYVREYVAKDYKIPASWFAVIKGNKITVKRLSHKTKRQVVGRAALGMIVPLMLNPPSNELDTIGAVVWLVVLVVAFVALITYFARRQ